MVTYIKQKYTGNIINQNGMWHDDKTSNHTFFIFANNQQEANEYAKSAIDKINEYAGSNERYIFGTEPKQIHVMSVTHDINTGTSVTGIWD
jgi:hypothetical protein